MTCKSIVHVHVVRNLITPSCIMQIKELYRQLYLQTKKRYTLFQNIKSNTNKLILESHVILIIRVLIGLKS